MRGLGRLKPLVVNTQYESNAAVLLFQRNQRGIDTRLSLYSVFVRASGGVLSDREQRREREGDDCTRMG